MDGRKRERDSYGARRDARQTQHRHPRQDNSRPAGSHLVAKHYNERPEVGVEKRKESKIIRLRSFNNWVKSVMIQRYVRQRDTVLDMGCGKGGDLNKMAKARIGHLIGADVAHVSLEQMQERYNGLRHKTFTAEFHALDCFVDHLTPRLLSDRPIDVVSMQFSLHYAFESVTKVRCMLDNISSRLRRGGHFIGTTPDAYWIAKRLKTDRITRFGNSVYSIDFGDDFDYRFRKFGCKYMFHLEDAVDCPEFLVHWPTFTQ